MEAVLSGALPIAAWQTFGAGLCMAFLVTTGLIIYLIRRDQIDPGFIGLIILLNTIFFLVSFSMLVAATTQGLDVKFMVIVVDGLILLGGKLLAPSFLRYLNDELIDGGVFPSNKDD